MEAIAIREFSRYTPLELLKGYKITNNILFEDGVVVTDMHYKELVFTMYLLQVVLDYPEVPIISSYRASNFYSEGMATSATPNKAFEVMLEDIIKKAFIGKGNFSNLHLIHKKMYEIINDIYNDFGYKCIEYSTGISILDYIEIQKDPRLLESIDKVRRVKTKESITESHNTLDTIIKTDPKYRHNPLSKAYISGMINPNQVKQLLGPRGYVTEIDGSIFQIPVASSFTLGMNNMYDLAIESRSAAKALFLSNIAVQNSEYLARELQLVSMVVEKVIKTDCGNDQYINWYVKPGTSDSKSDLSNLVGKHYWDEINNKESIITKNDKHLEGTVIKIRSVKDCRLSNPAEICSACIGDLAYSTHDHTAIGHLSTATLTRVITQNILSTKHLTASATTNQLKLSDAANKFFTIKGGDSYAFRSGITGRANTKISMILTQKEAFGIKDIKTVNDVDKLDITRISRIESIVLMVTTKNNTEYFPIVVKAEGKYGSFTVKFLKYIINKGYILDNQDRYVIDVTDWTLATPIIKMPSIEYSFLQLSTEVKDLLKSMKLVKDVKSKETPEVILQKLFDLVNSKLNINIAVLDIIVYAFTINSMERNDFRLGRNNPNKEIGDIKHIMPNRSLGGLYAWEYVAKNIYNPLSFSNMPRTNHPLDVMLMPNETVKEYTGL